MCDAPSVSSLLEWYDRNAREMPWRIGPADRKAGSKPDPYRVWLSEVMLQQTTVAAVKKYFLQFVEKWPTVVDLATADDADVMAEWAGLGYYARARNLLKCAREVTEKYHGRFPDNRDALLQLPGIGPYTASAIAAIAFDQPATVVDGNVERVISRVHAVLTPLPDAKDELSRLAESLTPTDRPGDYAQAVMDLGATVCTPRSPSCGICPWADPCAARRQGLAAELPRKKPKKAKPIRFGIAYLACRDDGAWLLETRPEKGLLGGMLGWPGTEWKIDDPIAAHPIDADWIDPDIEVRHTFTHFHLRLRVLFARVDKGVMPRRGNFVELDDFRPTDLPTVMRKAYDMVAGNGVLIESATYQPL
ncbi:MAG: A/G-specific adenine glycosylase [Silicimonas sp.]|nr:A/G-specific adenine glycosylase [Silicimonas sp.]